MNYKSMKCTICGGKSTLIHTGTRDNPSINVYECELCHTKQLDCLVDHDYENGFMNGKKMLDEDIKARIQECRFDDTRRAYMTKRYCKRKDVLDFGCGFGGYLSEISSIAKTVSGVELGVDEREYLIKKGYNVRDSIDKFDMEFDVITMFHVFEHLNDPRKWLSIISLKLKKGGVCFIEVPNANDALLSLYNNSAFENFTFWSAHLYLYSKESLTQIINENGSFVVEDDGQIQRYPISNTLYWLANGEPGGHYKWSFLDSENLNKEYYLRLKELNMCDTLFFRLRKR